MRGLPFVVGLQSSVQVAGDTDISFGGAGNALDEVDVFHIGEVNKSPPSLKLWRASFAVSI